MTSKVNAGKFSYQYGYDLRNRLASANITRKEGTQDVTITSSYTYNTAGIRTRAEQTINGITQNRYFLLDSGHTGYAQVFEETSTLGGNLVRSYVLGDDVLSQNVGGVNSHLLYDGHGSTRQLAGDDGGVTANYAYDAYGKMLGGNPNVTDKQSATDLLYAGEQFDPGLQMEYLRARYYDQDNGRFNRLDPFDGNSEDPQSLHKYAYAHADPVNGIDPSGNMAMLSVMSTMTTMSEVFSWQVMGAKGVLQGIKNIFGESYALNIALSILELYEYAEVAMFVIFAAIAVVKLAMDLPKIYRTIWKVASGIPDYIHHLQKVSKLSWSWKNVRRRLGTSGWALPRQQVHHKYIPRGGEGKLTFKGFFKEQWGRFVPDFIKNQKWNLMPTESPVMHNALHGVGKRPYNMAQRLWYGSGPVFKVGVVGLSVATAWFIDDYLNDND